MARKATTRKTAAKRPKAKTAAKAKGKPKAKAAAKKPAARKAAAKKRPVKKAPAKKPAAKQRPVKKAPAKKAVRKKTPAKRPAARKKTVAKKAPAKKAPLKKTAAAKKPVRKVTANRVAAKPKPAPKPEKPKLKKSPYTRTQLKPMRVALMTLRARLVGDIDLMGREALRADEADVDAENMADHGTDAFERNMTLELMENESRTLRSIDSALETMVAGRYGLCSECGEGIPLARLEALPFAQTCVPCQEAQERQP
jgi:RNA polymerase-binding protein DksA